MGNAHQDPFSQLVTVGQPLSSAEPALATNKTLMRPDGEEVLAAGRYKVTMTVMVTKRSKNVWESAQAPSKAAEVLITNGRVAWAWPDWKSDRSVGSFAERRIMSAFIERSEGGPLVIAGQLLPEWLRGVMVANADRRGRVEFSVQSYLPDGRLGRIRFQFPGGRADLLDAGQRLAAAAAAALTAKVVDDTSRAKLDEFIAGGCTPWSADWADGWTIPCALRHGAT